MKKPTLTERQVDTLLAIVAHHRVRHKPVDQIKLAHFLTTAPAVLTSHLCRLVQWRFINETKQGFTPTIEGESFALGCRYIGNRNFGHTILPMYAA